MSEYFKTIEMELDCTLEIRIMDKNPENFRKLLINPGEIIKIIELIPNKISYLWICDELKSCFDFTKIINPARDIKPKTKADSNQTIYTSSNFTKPLTEFMFLSKKSSLEKISIFEDPFLDDCYHKVDINELNEQMDTILVQLCP